ncbi:hypothetical protein CPB84DRAFT_1817152 [Gymnopilus junonius]|uniref:3-beta hydroxysteroid dehydrogenase/isomerase domain-containing protein n=1 Tax=Gymnopilus junonius TaxID=109634 RepID=A0A9P5NGF0_GYMJU|nr:hypothetical protein CPB84DRAFT_1817152 [Gymnopilus junonius]
MQFHVVAQWTSILLGPWIVLAFYIFWNDRRLKSVPDSALFFGPKRVTAQDVRATAERLANEPSIASKEVLPPRTGRRYIVVGGGGFLGGWIVTKLLDRGEDYHNIRIIDIAPPSGHHFVKDAIQKGVQFIKVDVTDAKALEAAFKAPWPALPAGRHLEFLDRSERVNVGGTQNVINASRAIGASVLVYTSSGSVAIHSTRLLLWPWEKEPQRFVQVINDDDARVPKRHEDFFSNYAATKMKAERLVRAADRTSIGKEKVMRTGCIRPGNGVFGPRGDMLCGAYLVRQTNPTWIGTVVQSFSYVENCAAAHLCYEARLIELQAGSKNPDIGGQAFCVADPGTTPTYGDAYTTLETLSDGECTFPTLSPTFMLLFSHVVEKYYRAHYALVSKGWWFAKLLPAVKGEIINLQPALFYLTSVHLIFDDSRARLTPEKGGLGYTGAWTTVEGLHKTVEEHKSGLHKVDNRSAGIGLNLQGGCL